MSDSRQSTVWRRSEGRKRGRKAYHRGRRGNGEMVRRIRRGAEKNFITENAEKKKQILRTQKAGAQDDKFMVGVMV